MENEYIRIPASLFQRNEPAAVVNRYIRANVVVEIVVWRGHDSGYAYRVRVTDPPESVCIRLWVAERELHKVYEPCDSPAALADILGGIWKPQAH